MLLGMLRNWISVLYFGCLTLGTTFYIYSGWLFVWSLLFVVSSCSVSSLMTTTEAVVFELPKDEKDAPAMGGGMGGMGGMDYWGTSNHDTHWV